MLSIKDERQQFAQTRQTHGRPRLSATDTPSFSASGKMKRSIGSLRIERQYRNVIDRFLAGTQPSFTHERHVQVANVLHHLPYGRELTHLGLQTMAHRHGIPEKYRPDITDMWWERLDGSLPDPAAFDDLPGWGGGASCVNLRYYLG